VAVELELTIEADRVEDMFELLRWIDVCGWFWWWLLIDSIDRCMSKLYWMLRKSGRVLRVFGLECVADVFFMLCDMGILIHAESTLRSSLQDPARYHYQPIAVFLGAAVQLCVAFQLSFIYCGCANHRAGCISSFRRAVSLGCQLRFDLLWLADQPCGTRYEVP
jgi:hypothetical protein